MAGNRDTEDDDVDTVAALCTGAGVKKVEAEAAMSEAIAIANNSRLLSLQIPRTIWIHNCLNTKMNPCQSLRYYWNTIARELG